MAQIDKPSLHFNTKLYTGNGNSSSRDITTNSQVDWLWIKNRGTTDSHVLVDNVRGANKQLYSNLTNAEATNTRISTLGSTSFTLATDNNSLNANNNNYVAWHWKANGAGSSNTDGSINSTVSANTTSGFSIVSYTGNGTSGATVGHGLGVTPDMLVVKNRDNGSYSFTIYHKSTGNSGCTFFTNDAFGNYSGAGYLRNPNNSTFETYFTSNGNSINASSDKYITYCFAEKKGFSKFSSYTGNGSTDGTFVYTGFKPAFVMIKRTGGTQDWIILDNKRPEYNETNRALFPNANYDDTGTDKGIDILSNGFKLRKNHEAINYSENYIYMAFAENPIVGSNNIPAVAR